MPMSGASDFEMYQQIKCQAQQLARLILDVKKPIQRPQVSYFLSQAKLLCELPIQEESMKLGGISCELLKSLKPYIGHFISGEWTAQRTLMAVNMHLPGFWQKLMTTPPMGDYARLCADHILSNRDICELSFLELGAGVGNLTSLIAKNMKSYLRTDKEAKLLNEKWQVQQEVYDFDKPAKWRDIHTVAAVNALHCAQNKRATLSYIYEILRSGGSLIFSEGQNPVLDNEPWALNLLFGFYDGWWDRGGFLTRTEWIETLDEVGFKNINFIKMNAGVYDLGGLIWAQR